MTTRTQHPSRSIPSLLLASLIAACAGGAEPGEQVEELRIAQADIDALAPRQQLELPMDDAAYVFDSSEQPIDFSRVTLSFPEGDVGMDEWMATQQAECRDDLLDPPGGLYRLRTHGPAATEPSGDGAASHELALSKCKLQQVCTTLCDPYGCTTECFYFCR